jgi:hypothetical protein
MVDPGNLEAAMPIDRHYLQISRRLREADLMKGPATAFDWGVGDPFDDRDEGSSRFLNYYSQQGICHGLEAYGIKAVLSRLGLSSYTVHLTSPDHFTHRMQVLLEGYEDSEHRLIDLSITVKRSSSQSVLGSEVKDIDIDMLQIEWLGMQNPLESFSRRRPPLPGQAYPGLGIGYTMHNIILLMARRTRRDGTLATPERFHLAALYSRYGYRFVDRGRQKQLESITQATGHLPICIVAWAAERGMLCLAGEPWRYTPGLMIAPVSKRLKRLIPQPSRMQRWLHHEQRPKVEVDIKGLRSSLTEKPVEGLDIDAVLAG